MPKNALPKAKSKIPGQSVTVWPPVLLHMHTRPPGFKQPLVITCSVESVGKFYWEYWAGSYASYAAYLMLQKGSDVVKCWGFFFFLPLSFFSEVAERLDFCQRNGKRNKTWGKGIYTHTQKTPNLNPPKNPKLNQRQENPEPLACERVVLKLP